MYKRVGFKIVEENEEEFIMICDLKWQLFDCLFML
jgi:hypothetical protein